MRVFRKEWRQSIMAHMGTSNELHGTITVLLQRVRNGDQAARESLFDQVYPEMRRLAESYVRNNGHSYPESATALVHRVCEKLLGRAEMRGNDRRHFLVVFGHMMHDAMIDVIRAERAAKRGGNVCKEEINTDCGEHHDASFELIDLRDGLRALESVDPLAAEVVNLRFFCGQTLEQAAETTDTTLSVVRQHADYGIAWLRARLSR